MAIRRRVPLLVVVALVTMLAALFTGCGEDEPAQQEVTADPQVTVAEVPAELAGFGDLATVEFAPVSLSVGGDGGSLALGDGASVTVPAGALEEEISLSVTIVGLALEYFDTRLGPARTYVIETDPDIGQLAEPIFLEVPFPSEIGAVASLEEGEWVGIDVASGDTTRIEITHFSQRLITYAPAGIEWLAELGWVAKQQAGVLMPDVYFPPETEQLLAEQEHQEWVISEADQSTRDFYGLDEEGNYILPIHTQEEMCAELGAVVAAYSAFSLPDGYSKYRLARYLFNAEAPSLDPYWPEFHAMTQHSMSAIDEKVLASTTPLTPGQVLQIAIDANGGNVPMGLLAAHNYLKDLSYLGRSYGDPSPEGKQELVPTPYGRPASHLESWRQDGATNPAGRLDKMGSLYHIFAAAVVKVWIPKMDQSSEESLGDYAVAGEALMRSFLWPLTGDTPDTEKGAADRCGARLADTVQMLTSQAEAGTTGSGEAGAPEGEPDGGETAASSPAEDGSPWVFEGTGLLVHSVDMEGAEVCKDPACPYVLTLFPDGRASLHVTRGFGWNEGECEDRDGNIYFGTWEDGTFSILGQFDAGGPIVDPSFLVSGTFTADLAAGKGEYDNEAGFSGLYDFEDPGLVRKVE